MAFVKKNTVNTNPVFYNTMLLGEPKIGKTTVMKEALELLVGDEYMFVEVGREKGADAIEGINYINCPTWNMDYDEDTNSVGWLDLVDDICENPSDYNIKVLAMDTYDQYIILAEDEALRLWNRKNPDKKADTLNGSWGGFGAGGKKAIELMFEQIDRLEAVGIKVWWIGHVKNKSVTDIVTGEAYEVITSDQQQNYFNALKKNLHFLGLALVDREIIKEKTGKKNLVTKKEETKSVIAKESRKIRFRDDNYAVDCGSRFANIIDEVDLDAQQFIDAMVNAIKAEQSKSGKSFEQAQKETKKAEEAKAKKVAEQAEANKAEKELEDIMGIVLDFIKENKTNMAIIKPILEKCKENNCKPTEVKDLALAKELLALIP